MTFHLWVRVVASALERRVRIVRDPPDIQPDSAPQLTQDVVSMIRRIANEPTAPLDLSLVRSPFYGQLPRVKVGTWRVDLTPATDDVMSGVRMLDEQPASDRAGWMRC